MVRVGKDRKSWLKAAAEAAATGKPIEITVRELLAKWGAQRRGYWIVQQIQQELADAKLTTMPDFQEVWIDATVEVLGVASDEPRDLEPPIENGVSIGQLPSANTGVTSLTPQDTIQKAQALMMRYDFSQLAVLSGTRDSTPQAITWESIAESRVRQSTVELSDALVSATVVSSDSDLIALIPQIIDAGFVLVRNSEKKINGIVTTADLGVLFANLASPFIMLGEIERRLRQVNGRVFTKAELAGARAPGDDERIISGASDLTLGEHERLMQRPEYWERYLWDIDRAEFLNALAAVREIRNDVMHFNPDPLSEDQLAELYAFLRWMRALSPSGTRA